MSTTGFRARVLAGEVLAGTFVKTPAHEVIEVLALSGLDFLCLDAEHAPFDRGRMDTCLAIGRALGVPMLVRVAAGRNELILSALDSGAVGIVVPHVAGVEQARAVARAARFGHGGRGFAGTTRWAGFATRDRPALLAESAQETLVIAQIEEPEGVDAVAEIAGVAGIDALFVGPSDLSVAYGVAGADSPEVVAAYEATGRACRAHGKGFATWVAGAETAAALRERGVSMFFAASEHTWMLQGARAAAGALHRLDSGD